MRYDIELEPDPINCTVTLIEPDHGLTAEPGGVLDIEWALSGYDDGEAYLSVFSGWDPAQYYFNAVVDNDGHHTWDVPAVSVPSGPPVRPSGIRTPRTSLLLHSAR